MDMEDLKSYGTLTGWQLLADQVVAAGEGTQRHDHPSQALLQEEQLQRLSSTGSVVMSEASEASSIAACVTPRPHQWLYKEYKLFEELGTGGFGVVKKARRLADGKLVVVKEIKTTSLSAKLKAAVMDEVDTLAKLGHPNIVKYCDCFMDDVYINIVMEYCDAGDLGHLIDSRAPGQHLGEDQIMLNFVQVACALHHVHAQGILHRDLKPSNVFMTSSGMVKLGDFGVSKASSLEATLMGRSIVGTPHYLSPEMCENKPYGKKSDVWALGCILAEMCLLAKPFNASSISTIILRILRGQYPQLPDCYSADLKALVARLLSPHPDQRPYVTELLQMPYVREHLKRYVAWAQSVPEAQPEVLAAALSASEPSCRRAPGKSSSRSRLSAAGRGLLTTTSSSPRSSDAVVAAVAAAEGVGGSMLAASAAAEVSAGQADRLKHQQLPFGTAPVPSLGLVLPAVLPMPSSGRLQYAQPALPSQQQQQQRAGRKSDPSTDSLHSGTLAGVHQSQQARAPPSCSSERPTRATTDGVPAPPAPAGPGPKSPEDSNCGGRGPGRGMSGPLGAVPNFSELLAAQTNHGISSSLADEQMEGLRRLRELKAKLLVHQTTCSSSGAGSSSNQSLGSAGTGVAAPLSPEPSSTKQLLSVHSMDSVEQHHLGGAEDPGAGGSWGYVA